MTNRIFSGILLACALTVLTNCKSSEERAEEHFTAALEHVENGDVARATVEFQNVFSRNGKHRDARATYAKMRRDHGDTAEAYSQYLRLVEQYPDDLEGRKSLAEMAIENGNWDELRRHGEYAAKLAPDDLTSRISIVALAYRDAVIGNNETGRSEAQKAALELLDEDPSHLGLRRLVIDDYIRLKDWKRALQAVDGALEYAPESPEFLQKRLGVLYAINDTDAIEQQLTTMVATFPDNQQMLAALVQWYISHGNIDHAETLLRDRVDPQDENPEAGATLVRFLSEFRGNGAAKEELDKLIASGSPHQALYRSLRASINFDTGSPQEAIAEMQAILEGAEPSAQTDNVKVGLARMLDTTGNPVGARALIEEVLERDSTHTEALKRRADWLIADDQTGDAIMTLRAALADTPNDPEIMTLMARAHERDGNKELMSEMLALAVENSNNGAAESLRYASHLMSQGKHLPAEDALLGALRIQPRNAQILAALGSLYIDMQDWGRTEHVAQTLRGLDSDQTTELANTLTARRLAAQNRETELNSFLESVSAGTEGVDTADIVIIRRFLDQDDTEQALDHVDKLLSVSPDTPMLHFVRASILAQSGRVSEAETIFNDLLEEDDQRAEVWTALYRLQRSSGNEEAALATLATARTTVPDSAQLAWVEAGELELAGDIDGAIAVYESLYAKDSSNQIVANNLASLLADHREDTESLERAYKVARRLRGSDVAPFQDTYGWIAYRLQNYDEAVAHLEPAADVMENNVTVQYHLAMAYAAAFRTDAALAQFEKVKAMIDPANPPAFVATMDAEIARLKEPQTEEAN
ncbi:tetratricopeptide repeat protein [Aliiroseovarius sp. F47248L]|uniref:tetratricopeptide repeat protein n=1 Tax=Aliiroseovarius sp. F47248L TaxID=2926420 RepID=UPI001FF3932C|nr:tetratricopeptide repeat protein [Aliiroseovarius sp. F47248L]MCK0140611.1 tetratricopeptide repeat protein [Aliiroseovarius sp. F47248L]